MLERRAGRIASGRFVVVRISASLLAVAVVGAMVIRIFDEQDFPSLTAAVTTGLIQRQQREREVTRDTGSSESLTAISAGITRLEDRLEPLGSRLSAED